MTAAQLRALIPVNWRAALDGNLPETELEQLAKARQATLHFLVGRRGSPDLPEDPFSPRGFRQLVPDVVRRDVFICGPSAMMEKVSATLASMGVPRSRIHYERFALL